MADSIFSDDFFRVLLLPKQDNIKVSSFCFDFSNFAQDLKLLYVLPRKKLRTVALLFVDDESPTDRAVDNPLVPLLPWPNTYQRNFLLCLDINGLLLHRLSQPETKIFVTNQNHEKEHINKTPVILGKTNYVFYRPGVQDFLNWLFHYFDVAVWSSANKTNVLAMCEVYIYIYI